MLVTWKKSMLLEGTVFKKENIKVFFDHVSDQKNFQVKRKIFYCKCKLISSQTYFRSSQNYLTSQERTYALQNSASLRMIYEELFRSNEAILLQTHRIRLNRYYSCFLGTELVNWMIAQNKAATRQVSHIRK